MLIAPLKGMWRTETNTGVFKEDDKKTGVKHFKLTSTSC